MAVLQYHRAGQASRGKAVLEVVLALVFTIVLMGIVSSVVTGVYGVHKLKDLPTPVRTLVTIGSIAALAPATLLAAVACGRAPATLLSVHRALRWRWLTTCLLVALVVRLIGPVFIALDIAFGRKEPASASEYLPTLAALLVIVPLQAAGEELFYRGTLLQAVGSFTRSAWPPIIISTALFTLSHGVRPELALAIAPLGLAAAWLTIRTGGLEAAMGYHIVLNTVGFATQFAIENGKRGINEDVHYLGAVFSAAFVIVYTLIVRRLAKRLAPGPDEVEQDAAKRGVGVEHPDHRGGAEPLAPEQQ